MIGSFPDVIHGQYMQINHSCIFTINFCISGCLDDIVSCVDDALVQLVQTHEKDEIILFKRFLADGLELHY